MLQQVQDLFLLKSSTADIKKKVPPSTNGNGQNGGKGHHRRRVRHQIRHGLRRAAAHALVGAMLVREKGFTLADAADWANSNPTYIVAMLTILDSGDEVMLDRVITDRAGVLEAAAQVKGLAKLLAAFKVATTENKAAFRKTIGDDALFDELFGSVAAPAANPVEIGAMSITVEDLGPAE